MKAIGKRKNRVIVVEDDLLLSASLGGALEGEGYAVRCCYSNREALEALREGAPDLMLLDRNLPDGDGLQLCMLLREDPGFHGVPVLFITGQGGVDDRVKGLRAGADDYLVKPFAMEELKARAAALLRRGLAPLKSRPAQALRAAGLALEKNTVKWRGGSARLGPVEVKLLRFFMQRPGICLSHGLLGDAVWGDSGTGSLDMSILRLRRKLASSGARLATLKGGGYTLTASRAR